MKEKSVAEKFKVIFPNYPLFVLRNNAQGGWADRMMQLPYSQVCMVEHKLVEVNQNNTFRITTFRPDQAAWFARWQKNGGLCFLFLGLVDHLEKLIGYAMLTYKVWDHWLEVNKTSFRLDDLQYISTDTNVIRCWFEEWRHKYRVPELLAAE